MRKKPCWWHVIVLQHFKLIKLLRKENQEALKHDIALAPEWIKIILRKEVGI
jgi:hypothetical protein